MQWGGGGGGPKKHQVSQLLCSWCAWCDVSFPRSQDGPLWYESGLVCHAVVACSTPASFGVLFVLSQSVEAVTKEVADAAAARSARLVRVGIWR